MLKILRKSCTSSITKFLNKKACIYVESIPDLSKNLSHPPTHPSDQRVLYKDEFSHHILSHSVQYSSFPPLALSVTFVPTASQLAFPISCCRHKKHCMLSYRLLKSHGQKQITYRSTSMLIINNNYRNLPYTYL